MFTYRVSTCWMVAMSVASAGLTNAPSDTTARPMRPLIGASTRVYSTLSAAWATAALAAARSAWACLKDVCVATHSCWLMALASASGRLRSSVAWALARLASARAWLACALSRAARYAALSILNSGSPSLTRAPSVNSRFLTTPETRARTCAVRAASRRPVSSALSFTGAGCTVTTPTWAGGMPPPGPPAEPPHAVTSHSGSDQTTRRWASSTTRETDE